MSESKTPTPRTDSHLHFCPNDKGGSYSVVKAAFARTLELELNEAASLFEEIENYAMTANQSVLEGKEPIRKEIFRDIRDMAKRGCNRDFQNNTWSELQKVKAQLTTAQQEIADLKRVVSYVAQFSKDSAMKGVGSK